MHTALKIAPVYSAPVVHMKDASQNAGVAARLLNPQQREALVAQLESEYSELRAKNGESVKPTVSLEEAKKGKLELF
jgi:5-methyltetrahydrofolate--homocysteine methyltransferase